METFNVFCASLIVICSAVEAVCATEAYKILHARAEQERDERMEQLRAEAYSASHERQRIKENRDKSFALISDESQIYKK